MSRQFQNENFKSVWQKQSSSNSLALYNLRNMHNAAIDLIRWFIWYCLNNDVTNYTPSALTLESEDLADVRAHVNQVAQ